MTEFPSRRELRRRARAEQEAKAAQETQAAQEAHDAQAAATAQPETADSASHQSVAPSAQDDLGDAEPQADLIDAIGARAEASHSPHVTIAEVTAAARRERPTGAADSAHVHGTAGASEAGGHISSIPASADHRLGRAHYDEFGNYLGHPQFDAAGRYVAHALFDDDGEFTGHVQYHDEAGQLVVPQYEPADDEDAEPAAQSERERRSGLSSTVALLVALALVAAAALFVVKIVVPGFTGGSAAISDYPGPGHGEVQVVVNPGDTGRMIATTLYNAGVVATEKSFIEAYSANTQASSITPGTYALKLEMKAADAVNALLDPATRVELRLTIPEGWTVAQIFDRIQTLTGISTTELQAALSDPAVGLPPEVVDQPEGWFFPATYLIQPGASAVEILSPIVAKTFAILDAHGVAPEDRQRVLTIASIAEKEVNTTEYYGMVVRVIENRLAQGIQLGMDTVNAYGLNKRALDLTQEDLAQDNPYNSRIHLGLPPTPICNPGEAAIMATLDPPEGTWTYFVTVNLDTGETKFTDDYGEFLEFKAEYLEFMETWQG